MSRAVLLAALLVTALTGCAGGYLALEATAKAGSAAVKEFEVYDAAHKRELLAAAAPRCAALAEPRPCLEESLRPYQAAREPVLKVADEMAPLIKLASSAGLSDASAGKLTAQIAEVIARLATLLASLKGGR